MTDFQRVIKYLANIFAVFLIIGIVLTVLKFAGLMKFISNSDGTTKEVTTYSVSQDITDLKIEINAAALNIYESDSFFVSSNLKDLTVSDKAGTLLIKDTKKLVKNYNNAVLNVYIPKGFSFENINITTGAGSFKADLLSSDSLNLKLGAGQVSILSLYANNKAKIEGGAGEVTISSGEINNLDLDMGVGEAKITARLLGRNELNFGVGEAKLTLSGSLSDYRIDFDKGLGEGKLMDEKMKDDGIYGSGETKIETDGGVGNVSISFTK